MGASAFGTELLLTYGGDMVAVAELTNIGGPSLGVDTIDVSSHQSPEAHREYVGGLIDAGEMGIEGNLTQLNAEMITDLMAGRAVVAGEVKWPPYLKSALLYKFSKWEFSGIVTTMNPGAPHDGKLGFTGAVKLTGATEPTESDIWMVTFDAKEGVTPVAGASIQLYSDAGRLVEVGWPRSTGADGKVIFLLEDATYYSTTTKTGYVPKEDSIVVNGANKTKAIALTGV